MIKVIWNLMAALLMMFLLPLATIYSMIIFCFGGVDD